MFGANSAGSHVGTVQDILDVIVEQRHRFAQQSLTEQQRAIVIERTGWLMTYLTSERTLRLAAYHGDLGEGLCGYPPGQGTCIVPLYGDRYLTQETANE